MTRPGGWPGASRPSLVWRARRQPCARRLAFGGGLLGGSLLSRRGALGSSLLGGSLGGGSLRGSLLSGDALSRSLLGGGLLGGCLLRGGRSAAAFSAAASLAASLPPAAAFSAAAFSAASGGLLSRRLLGGSLLSRSLLSGSLLSRSLLSGSLLGRSLLGSGTLSRSLLSRSLLSSFSAAAFSAAARSSAALRSAAARWAAASSRALAAASAFSLRRGGSLGGSLLGGGPGLGGLVHLGLGGLDGDGGRGHRGHLRHLNLGDLDFGDLDLGHFDLGDVKLWHVELGDGEGAPAPAAAAPAGPSRGQSEGSSFFSGSGVGMVISGREGISSLGAAGLRHLERGSRRESRDGGRRRTGHDSSDAACIEGRGVVLDPSEGYSMSYGEVQHGTTSLHGLGGLALHLLGVGGFALRLLLSELGGLVSLGGGIRLLGGLDGGSFVGLGLLGLGLGLSLGLFGLGLGCDASISTLAALALAASASALALASSLGLGGSLLLGLGLGSSLGRPSPARPWPWPQPRSRIARLVTLQIARSFPRGGLPPSPSSARGPDGSRSTGLNSSLPPVPTLHRRRRRRRRGLWRPTTHGPRGLAAQRGRLGLPRPANGAFVEGIDAKNLDLDINHGDVTLQSLRLNGLPSAGFARRSGRWPARHRARQGAVAQPFSSPGSSRCRRCTCCSRQSLPAPGGGLLIGGSARQRARSRPRREALGAWESVSWAAKRVASAGSTRRSTSSFARCCRSSRSRSSMSTCGSSKGRAVPPSRRRDPGSRCV